MNGEASERPILIGCAQSSGSTLLSLMLDAHPQIHCGPELSLLTHPGMFAGPFAEFRERLRYFLTPPRFMTSEPLERMRMGFCPYILLDSPNLGYYGHDLGSLNEALARHQTLEGFLTEFFQPSLARTGKVIWAEKSPANVFSLSAFLERFPRGKVIYLVRNGLDLVCSLLKRGFGLKHAISHWLLETAICETLHGHPRALRVRYEDLVSQPRQTMLGVLEFLQVAPEMDRVLEPGRHSARFQSDAGSRGIATWKSKPSDPITTRSVERWRHELDDDRRLLFSRCRLVCAPDGYASISGVSTSDLLRQLGYDMPSPPTACSSQIVDLVEREAFLASGEAYDHTEFFHERFVEAEPRDVTGVVFSADLLRSLRWEAGHRLHRVGVSRLQAIIRAQLGAIEANQAALKAQVEQLGKEQAALQATHAAIQAQLHEVSGQDLLRRMRRTVGRIKHTFVELISRGKRTRNEDADAGSGAGAVHGFNAWTVRRTSEKTETSARE